MSPPDTQRAVIVGAGPAGLTAAFDLLERTSIVPIVLEKHDSVGGLSRTVEYRGNRIDIGGHRFFTKSDRVMDWWLRFLPLQALEGRDLTITYHRQSRSVESPSSGPDPHECDRVMLVRPRRSRIHHGGKLFDYPISLSFDTLGKLGFWRSSRLLGSYLRSVLRPIAKPANLEEFFINRFGRELYETFFKSYTEKVWGVPCHEIDARWGAQRIKGLSVARAVRHFARSLLPGSRGEAQKDTETSLIEQFLYPKYGPGQMWDTVAEEIIDRGGDIRTGHEVTRIATSRDGHVRSIIAVDRGTGEEHVIEGEYLFSSMPVQHLVRALGEAVARSTVEIGEGLVYRDFVTVGLLLERLEIEEPGRGGPVRDTWIYIQEPGVRVGRLQIFNNWSPYMVADPATTWIGLEYFCDEGDEVWSRDDDEMKALAVAELERIGLLDPRRVLDGVVVRVPKTYPAYLGTYHRFDDLRRDLDRFENLFLIGRNGMHRYNNQDHSMLTAMVAVDNILAGRTDKSNLWEVNTERDHLEERTASTRDRRSELRGDPESGPRRG